MIKYSDIRKNVTCCHVQLSCLTDISMVCTEWWNGEGLDFDFSEGKTEKRISLHLDEMEALVLGMMINNMLDMEHINEMYHEIIAKQKTKEYEMKNFETKTYYGF